MTSGDCFALQQLLKNCDLQDKGKVKKVYFSRKACISRVLIFVCDTYSASFSYLLPWNLLFPIIFCLSFPRDSSLLLFLKSLPRDYKNCTSLLYMFRFILRYASHDTDQFLGRYDSCEQDQQRLGRYVTREKLSYRLKPSAFSITQNQSSPCC